MQIKYRKLDKKYFQCSTLTQQQSIRIVVNGALEGGALSDVHGGFTSIGVTQEDTIVLTTNDIEVNVALIGQKGKKLDTTS
jgi:hypothetical protein